MTVHTTDNAVTLEGLQRLIGQLIAVPQTQNVWVTAELSDVAVRGGHCYLELIQKDGSGRAVAKARGIIWASLYPSLSRSFEQATGQRFTSGIKVMVRCSAGHHPLYGMSLVISSVNPEYTMGDLLRRRREIVERLTREGIIDMNRSLAWAAVPQRIAVVSAPGAAGLGDFINQLYNNTRHLRFDVGFYAAVMQGEKAAASVRDALGRIFDDDEQQRYDGVVIIRGGGSTSDLSAFEDYDLAATVAQFPLPVIIGIGHERDITLLDYVANMRVKTPTAAAEWLVGRGNAALQALEEAAGAIQRTVADRLSGYLQQLAYIEGKLPAAPAMALAKASERLRRIGALLEQAAPLRLAPLGQRLDTMTESVRIAMANIVARRRDRLAALEQMAQALSPAATLARGYSITRINGHAVTDAAELKPGDCITTLFAKGETTSTINTPT